MKNYKQLCVLPATLPPDNVNEFEEFFKENFGVKDTLPDPGKEYTTGGRSDLLFYIHDKDVGKFAVPRLRMGVRWWEDVFYNDQEYLYSEEILNKYPKTW
jgi:hypothetical protein